MSEIATIDSTAVATAEVVQPVEDGQLVVIAERPAEMATAQANLIVWASQKVAAVKRELDGANESLAQASACGLRLDGIRRVVRNLALSVSYYEKVHAALELGYCLVPNFPGDVVAIRTDCDLPGGRIAQNWRPGRELDQIADQLELGDGKYVSPTPTFWKEDEFEINGKGERVFKRRWWEAKEFRDVALPVKFMKPRLLEATQAAMAAKVFDEICTVDGPRGRKKSDPLIIGRVLGPKEVMLSFLIGWFIDTRDL